ncbi:hypothetical protein, partial [uncultured Tateyamaria sp.]
MDGSTAERVVKSVAIGRKNWMFAGSESGNLSTWRGFHLRLGATFLSLSAPQS